MLQMVGKEYEAKYVVQLIHMQREIITIQKTTVKTKNYFI